jgi:nucleoside-diphosphate-sugar epimerase
MSTDIRPRLLVVGGSGLVGNLIVPDLARRYRIRVLDPRPPGYDAEVEHIEGTSTDFETLRSGMDGVDAWVYLAMGPKDPAVWEQPKLAALQFDMAVTGMYLTTRAAGEGRVMRGVYASSMSVFTDYGRTDGPIGDQPPDAMDFYGLAKRLGETVACAAARRYEIGVTALRLALPMYDADWLAATDPFVACVGTAGSDVSRAFGLALDRDGAGFEAVPISGDHRSRYADMSMARTLLGWEPLMRHPMMP